LVALLIVLLLLALLFGGLGVAVTKTFFVALAVVLIVALLFGGFGMRGGSRVYAPGNADESPRFIEGDEGCSS
jgi:Na+/H+ antiporter NhaC